ncbi:nitroreductase family protein [Actinacidiphila glaucinigra]|uniref:nitroreductase family protein n=1 Tax=Actinacidiphila glaucinigra TaxID=235986 RepID=UPI002E30CD27|nr:nitroreductase family protein [Actinacidiphila glaucinigra]
MHAVVIALALIAVALPRRIYYYDDYRDTLVDTRLRFDDEALDVCLARQGMVHASAAILVAVCSAARLAWKYRDPRGYLDAYTNAGHAMQNAALYAESLGIGAWITTAMDTGAMSSLMSLRGDEFPLAAMALGNP